MSVLSEKVRKGIFSKLNVSGVTSRAIGGVHHLIAMEEIDSGGEMIPTPYPFVVFAELDPSNPNFTFGSAGNGPNITSEESEWVIKATADKSASTTEEPQTVVEEILALCETAIGNSLNLAGGSETEAVYRKGDIPPMTETLVDRTIFTHGFKLRVVAKL